MIATDYYIVTYPFFQSFCLTYPEHNLLSNAFLKINPMPSAHVAQSVERVLGKDEVGGSNPLVGSI